MFELKLHYFERNCIFTLFALFRWLQNEVKEIADEGNLKHRQNIAIFYRIIQLFAIVSNQCFQTYMWPAIQFIGGMLIIAILYCLLVFKRSLPLVGIICLMFLMVSMILVCCMMLDLGSRPMLISGKIVQQAKKTYRCRWSRKFFKSCPVIALRIGEFHKMDRQRVSAFVRFILQRTFFLVLKTKLGIGFGNDVVIRMPFVEL